MLSHAPKHSMWSVMAPVKFCDYSGWNWHLFGIASEAWVSNASGLLTFQIVSVFTTAICA